MAENELTAGKQRQKDLEQRLEDKRRQYKEAKENVERRLRGYRQEEHDKRQQVLDQAKAELEEGRLHWTEDMNRVREELRMKTEELVQEQDGWDLQYSDLMESLEKLKREFHDAKSALDEKRQRCIDLTADKVDLENQNTALDQELETILSERRTTVLQLNNDKMELTRQLQVRNTEFDDTCQTHQAKVDADFLAMEGQHAAYGKLNSSNLALEKTMAGLQSDLATAMSRSSADWKDLEERRAATEQARDLLTQQLREKTSEYDQTKADADRLQGRIEELDVSNTALTTELAEKTVEHMQTLENHRRLKVDMEVLVGEKVILAVEKAALVTEKESLAAEKDTLVAEKAALDVQLETQRQALEKEKEARLEEKQGLEMRLNEQKEALRSEKKAFEKTLAQQVERYNKLRQEAEDTTMENTATQSLLTFEQKELQKLRAEHNILSDTLSHRDRRINEINKSQAEMKQHEQELIDELTTCRADITALKNENRTLTADQELRHRQHILDIEKAVSTKTTALKTEHSHNINRLMQHQSTTSTALQGKLEAQKSESDRKHRLELEKLQHDKDEEVKELKLQVLNRNRYLNRIRERLEVPFAPPDDKGSSPYPLTEVLTAIQGGRNAQVSTTQHEAVIWGAIGAIDPELKSIDAEQVVPLVKNVIADRRDLRGALSSAKAELESLRKVRETLGQVQVEKDSLQQEKHSLQQEKDFLQEEFKQSQLKLANMSGLPEQLCTTQNLLNTSQSLITTLQQLSKSQQTGPRSSPPTSNSVAGQVPLNDHHCTNRAESSLENTLQSSSSGKRTATDSAASPEKRLRLGEPDILPAGSSTSGLANMLGQDPNVQLEGPHERPAAAVPNYGFLKEEVNPFNCSTLANSLWDKAQLPVGVTATIDAAMVAWRGKKSDWASPRKTSRNCVDSHLNHRRLLKVGAGKPYACRRCVENRLPCVVVPRGFNPVVLPLHPTKRAPGVTWQELGFWVKGADELSVRND